MNRLSMFILLSSFSSAVRHPRKGQYFHIFCAIVQVTNRRLAKNFYLTHFRLGHIPVPDAEKGRPEGRPKGLTTG